MSSLLGNIKEIFTKPCPLSLALGPFLLPFHVPASQPHRSLLSSCSPLLSLPWVLCWDSCFTAFPHLQMSPINQSSREMLPCHESYYFLSWQWSQLHVFLPPKREEYSLWACGSLCTCLISMNCLWTSEPTIYHKQTRPYANSGRTWVLPPPWVFLLTMSHSKFWADTKDSCL